MQYASPATVSRAGMVYVDPKNLGYQPFLDKWINSRNESEKNLLKKLTEKYVDGAIKLILEGMLGLQQVTPLKMVIDQTGLNMVGLLICLIINKNGSQNMLMTNRVNFTRSINFASTWTFFIQPQK